MKTLVLTMCILISGSVFSSADVIKEKDAISAIIGEAESEGYHGMLAVACAIRNRGTLKGVYGLRSKRVTEKMYSTKIYKMAKLAWEESKTIDVTNGANHWENVKLFGRPSWVDFCINTYNIKNHRFYFCF